MSNIRQIDKRIEKLKDKWAKEDLSPFSFWVKYIRIKGIDYKRFLRKLNWDGEITPGMSEGINKYLMEKKDVKS